MVTPRSRRTHGWTAKVPPAFLVGLIAVLAWSCADSGGDARTAVPGVAGAEKTIALVRAERRLFDGAPPVIPHQPFGADCTSCHAGRGMSVDGVGYSPPSPHARTDGMQAIAGTGAFARCEQCHVFQQGVEPFVPNSFDGLHQDLRAGRRLNDQAPPVIPHRVFMRENCIACHGGPAAREEIRTDHPERPRCQQCHLEQVTTTTFQPQDS